jgi:hypothetical protein
VGITNIISRTELFKGNVLIDSAPGMGCTMSICFSLAGWPEHAALSVNDIAA